MRVNLNISLEAPLSKRRFLYASLFLVVLIVEIVLFWRFKSIVLMVFNGPLLYLFSLLFIDEQKVSVERAMAHFVMPLLYVFLLNSVLSQNGLYTVGVPFLSLVVYGCFVLLNDHKYELDLQISVWVKYMGYLLIILGIILFVYYLRVEEVVSLQFDAFQYTIIILVFILVYTLFLLSNLVIYNRKYACPNSIEVEESGVNVVTNNALRHQMLLSDYFKTTKNYLKPDFSYDDFVSDIGIEKKDLSIILNKELNISFFNLLALKRIEMAKKLMKEKSDIYTLEHIMLEAGFQSKSTFNRNFKRIVGMTPSEYRDVYLKKEVNVRL